MEFDASVLIKRSDDMKLPSEADQQLMTLHCKHCSTILADSLGVCGEVKSMDFIMCLRVTNDVVVSGKMESGHEGKLANCIYSSVKCRNCCSVLGKVVHATPLHMAMIRSIFLLLKANISCYILNSSSMVKATTLTFDLKPLGERMNEVRLQIEAQLDHLMHMRSRLFSSSIASQSDKQGAHAV
ncbi:protein Mis18-beta [Aulostomus maculatus]